MGFFIFLMIAVCIAYLLFWGKSSEGSNSTGVLIEKDDFADGSIRSFFLLEEIVDSGVGGRGTISQDFPQSEQIEDDYFEEDGDYFEDEFFE